MNNETLFHALNTARAGGCRVYPIDKVTLEPLVPDFETVASDDPEEIEALFSDHPGAGVGTIRKPPTIAATPFEWTEASAIPPREFIYGEHLVRQFMSTTVAPGGVGKSSLTIVEALAIATGRALLGIEPAERCRVWLWNGEDPLEELQRRITAACLYFGITRAELEGWLFVDSGRQTELVIAAQTRDGTRIAEPVVQAIVGTVEDNEIGVLIVDPFVASHRVTENDNNAIERVAKTWARIADVTGCAVELVHHSRKTGGAEVTVEDGRGASALLAAARSGRVLNTMSPDEAAKAGVENRRLYFRVENGKANLAPPPDAATWYRLQSVALGNGSGDRPGDRVGVVTPWAWPDPMAEATPEALAKVQAALSEGEHAENVQANTWAGHAVAEALGLDCDDRQDRARIRGMLKGWIEAGALRIETTRDTRNGRDRRIIVPGHRP